ncbi:OmpH family outer membrane protein [Porphyromonadaceae bacterium]
MKNLNYIINGVLAVAVIVLYVLNFTSKNNKETASFESSGSVVEMATLPIAYVNTDSLLRAYNFAKDMDEALVRKQENAKLTINQQMRKLDQEVSEFQRKVENNAFLTRERGEQEQARLIKKEQEIRQQSDRLAAELALEQQTMNEKLRDNIYSFLKEYNAVKKYQIIMANNSNDNIMLADKAYDITNEVVLELNKRYNPSVASSTESK